MKPTMTFIWYFPNYPTFGCLKYHAHWRLVGRCTIVRAPKRVHLRRDHDSNHTHLLPTHHLLTLHLHHLRDHRVLLPRRAQSLLIAAHLFPSLSFSRIHHHILINSPTYPPWRSTPKTGRSTRTKLWSSLCSHRARAKN